jgi:hypothetical protein
MREIISPCPIPTNLEKPSVFLAGSIDQGTALNWQSEVCRSLSDLDICILNPRRTEWDASWVQSINNPQFREQVEWELNCLDRVDIIAMYFAPNSKAPITLLEFGLHARSTKLLVACPEMFWRRGNVEVVANRYSIPLYNDLDALLLAIRSSISSKST